MRNLNLHKLYVLLLAGSSVVLGACNGGSNTLGSDAVGPTVQANNSGVRAMFAANSCFSGKVNLSGSGWYLSGNLTITNTCSSDQSVLNNTISFKSQNLAGVGVSVGSLNNWYINGGQYTLNFVPGGGNLVSATLAVSNGNSTGVVHAGQSIEFDGGVNMPDSISAYDTASANSTLSIGGSAPVAQTGSMTVAVDTKNASCTTSSCNGLNVQIKDSQGNTKATINVPASSFGAVYSQTVESLNVGSYSLVASNVTNTTITYTPSANPGVTANINTPVTVSYALVAQTGTATIKVPSLVSSYAGTLAVKVLNTKSNNQVVANLSVAQGQSVTTSALPISDATHQYAVQVQGVADPLSGKYYIESGLPLVTISNGQNSSLNVPFTASSVTKQSLTFNLSGLAASDSATATFQDGSQKYVYASYSGLKNAQVSYQFEKNTQLGYTVTASSNNYKVNPIESNITVSANVTLALAFESIPAPPPGGSMVAGWPTYLAMGAVGGPNTDPLAQRDSGGDDSFGGKPVDAVFKYAGVNGNGDPGVIDPPMNALRMSTDLTNAAVVNDRASRVVIVEYTGEMSGGENFSDFTNTSTPNTDKQGATYIMARHFVSLAADALALANSPVVKNGKNYYGSLIMNPDLLGAMQQNGYIASVNAQLPANAVNAAVDQALCLLSNSRSYTNTAAPNGANGQVYINKTYTGTPYQILTAMLNDGYPAWSISAQNDAFWGTGINNQLSASDTTTASQLGKWFNSCITNPSYDSTKYQRPNFPAGFDGWVQANNWLIRTMAPKSSGVTFGWQDNMWAVNSGFWLHNQLTESQIDRQYSAPVASWLKTNAPSTISNVGSAYAPDYFVFDRYEMDDSAAPGSATLYSANSWDNYLNAIGLVSKKFSNIPVMLWQIPGSHLPYQYESTPELFNATAGNYIFSTAPVYFFGDSNLKSDLSNLIIGASNGTSNVAVGSYLMASNYNCPLTSCNYQQYLRYYQGRANNYDWSKNNNKLALAASNNVFAILWGGGNTTNVIKNFSNPNDHGWLASKLITYYKNPQALQ